jgi:hypothetical protein
MRSDQVMHLTGLLGVLSLLWGCALERVYIDYDFEPDYQVYDQRPNQGQQKAGLLVKTAPSSGWTKRVVTEQELLRLRDRDHELTLYRCWEILGRLNNKATYYISSEIKNRKPLKVPNNFSDYKNWTPLPRGIPAVASVPKFILVAKDIPFFGWYAHGNLIGDSQVCLGKPGDATKPGLYKVLDKDVDHVSRSYTNDFGEPSPMPYGLRIYEHVWIHGGDIPGGYCSHGCVNLPLPTAEKVFRWSDTATVVMIVNSLNDLPRILEDNQSNCILDVHQCTRTKAATNK